MRLELMLRHLRARRRGDPWGFCAEHEQFRFRETNRLLHEWFGRVGSLLEMGCGEGHQSEHLRSACDQLTGIDFSSLSIERAAARVPDARFRVVDLEALEVDDWPDGFDLVAAFECLYYLRDVEAALRKIDSLGRQCMVSSVQPKFVSLDAYLGGNPGVRSETIRFGGWTWKLYCWKGGTLFPPAAGLRVAADVRGRERSAT